MNGRKHNLRKDYGHFDATKGYIKRPSFRCTCGQWNAQAKSGSDLELERMERDFNLHCAQVGHAFRK